MGGRGNVRCERCNAAHPRRRRRRRACAAARTPRPVARRAQALSRRLGCCDVGDRRRRRHLQQQRQRWRQRQRASGSQWSACLANAALLLQHRRWRPARSGLGATVGLVDSSESDAAATTAATAPAARPVVAHNALSSLRVCDGSSRRKSSPHCAPDARCSVDRGARRPACNADGHGVPMPTTGAARAPCPRTRPVRRSRRPGAAPGRFASGHEARDVFVRAMRATACLTVPIGSSRSEVPRPRGGGGRQSALATHAAAAQTGRRGRTTLRPGHADDRRHALRG